MGRALEKSDITMPKKKKVFKSEDGDSITFEQEVTPTKKPKTAKPGKFVTIEGARGRIGVKYVPGADGSSRRRCCAMLKLAETIDEATPFRAASKLPQHEIPEVPRS